MSQQFKARNRAVTNEEKRLASLTMYENYICQYKALLLQCERDYDLMIYQRDNFSANNCPILCN